MRVGRDLDAGEEEVAQDERWAVSARYRRERLPLSEIGVHCSVQRIETLLSNLRMIPVQRPYAKEVVGIVVTTTRSMIGSPDQSTQLLTADREFSHVERLG